MASYIGARPEGLVLTGDIANDAVTSAKIDSTSTGMALADLTVDTSTLVVDATNNRVNIGTATGVSGYPLRVANNSGNSQVLITAGSLYNSTIAFGDQDANDTGQIIYASNGDSMRFHTNGGERLRILSGGGLTFNGDTAAANALDDYEEGTFTGPLDGEGSSPSTTVTETGRYTKIGRLVYATIAFEAVNTTGASGDVEITGWPFRAAGRSSVTLISSGVVSSFQTINVLSDTANLAPFFETATKLIFLETRNSAVAWGIAEHSAGTNRYLYIAVVYEAA